jgi:hypothetical protein
MCELLANIREERLEMIKSLFIYYRWNTKMVYNYDLVVFRLQAVRDYLAQLNFAVKHKRSILMEHPQLACLLMP